MTPFPPHTGRAAARRLLGLSHHSHYGQQGSAPRDPADLSALTGQPWRWLEVGPGSVVATYDRLRQAWAPYATVVHHLWDHLMASRHGQWLVLYGVRGPTSPHGELLSPLLGFSSPELDREGAEKVRRQLRDGLGISTLLLETNNPAVQFIVAPDVSLHNAHVLETLGFAPPYHLLTAAEEADPSSWPEGGWWRDRVAWDDRITRLVIDALSRPGPEGPA